jgi:periplasmic divalent cation tolerance protein
MPALILLSTFPDLETARRIVRALVEERLIACGNLVPSVESIYRWKDAVESSPEIVGILKTTEEGYPRLEARLREMHPYELPEMVAIKPSGGLPAYLQWVEENSGERAS